jgi:hypothetical protein
MGRIGLAFRAFFAILFNREVGERAPSLFEDKLLPKVTTSEPAPPAERKPARPARSEALTLLETLQREARLIDLCQDSLDAYSDEQIGAAARNVLRDSGQVLTRLFALQPVASEGEPLEIADGFDPARYRLTGNVARPPYRGRVTHGGWQATRCELPHWTGTKDSAFIVAPAEVEVA